MSEASSATTRDADLDEQDEDEEEATVYLSVMRDNLLETIEERGEQFWACTGFSEFGPCATFEEMTRVPEEGPVNILTCSVSEVWSDQFTADELLKFTCADSVNSFCDVFGYPNQENAR